MTIWFPDLSNNNGALTLESGTVALVQKLQRERTSLMVHINTISMKHTE